MSEKIFFMNLTRQYQLIKNEIQEAFESVCEKTAFAGGPFVEAFEKRFAEYCKTEFAVGVNSGTSSLHLAMCAFGIQPGDEVIVPASTFIASAWAPVYVNAKPVFIDCTADTWNIDAGAIEEKITPRTRVILGVHLYGQPFDIDAVRAAADKHNLFLIEDCAQAHGARYKGHPVGGYGEMGCFSFYPGKNLGAYGEGGAVVTNNQQYANAVKSLRDHGSNKKYYHDTVGFNMRMDGIQAAILDVKLKYLDAWNNRRKEIAKMYRKGIHNDKIKMQHQPEWADPVYHLFVVTTKNRDECMTYLKENDIFPGLHYPVPCHLQKAFAHLGCKEGDFPNTEYLANHCLSLPMFPELTDEEINRVIHVINRYS